MKNSSVAALNGFLVALMFAIAFWTIHALPAGGQVAIHWGPDNRADAWVGGAAIHLINPIIGLVLWFLMTIAPQGFAARGKPPASVHRRFSSVFLVQLAIQLLIANLVLGR